MLLNLSTEYATASRVPGDSVCRDVKFQLLFCQVFWSGHGPSEYQCPEDVQEDAPEKPNKKVVLDVVAHVKAQKAQKAQKPPKVPANQEEVHVNQENLLAKVHANQEVPALQDDHLEDAVQENNKEVMMKHRKMNK